MKRASQRRARRSGAAACAAPARVLVATRGAPCTSLCYRYHRLQRLPSIGQLLSRGCTDLAPACLKGGRGVAVRLQPHRRRLRSSELRRSRHRAGTHPPTIQQRPSPARGGERGQWRVLATPLSRSAPSRHALTCRTCTLAQPTCFGWLPFRPPPPGLWAPRTAHSEPRQLLVVHQCTSAVRSRPACVPPLGLQQLKHSSRGWYTRPKPLWRVRRAQARSIAGATAASLARLRRRPPWQDRAPATTPQPAP